VQGSILYSAQNCKESKSLEESHNVLRHKGLYKEDAMNTKLWAVSGTVLGKEKVHKSSTGYMKTGLIAQNTSAKENEHSQQLRAFLLCISSYLPLLFNNHCI